MRVSEATLQPLRGGLSETSQLRSLVGDDIAKILGVNQVTDLSNLEGSSVFLRVDANVSPDAKNIALHPRVKQIVGVLGYLCEKGCKVLVSTHRSGANSQLSDHSVEELYNAISSEVPLIREFVKFLKLNPSETCGASIREGRYLTRVAKEFARLDGGHALLLENVRLLPSERRLAFREDRIRAVFDFVINDAFGVGHRADQFSVDGISKIFPANRRALGPGAVIEWGKIFEFVANAQERSIGIVLGGDGEKFGTKLLLLERILKSNKIGAVYLGGLFGTTLLASNGAQLGKTPYSSDSTHQRSLRDLVLNLPDVRFLLPDCYVGMNKDGELCKWRTRVKSGSMTLNLPDGAIALDQSPFNPQREFESSGVTRVLGVGPLGYYKKAPFGEGTLGSYRALSDWAKAGSGRTVIFGGGNSLEFLLRDHNFSAADGGVWLSSGGGALLEALAQVLGYVDRGEPISTPAVIALKRGVTS